VGGIEYVVAMAHTSDAAAGNALVHTALGDFFVSEGSALHAEVRETGGHARAGLGMLSSRLGPGETVLDLGAGVGMLAVPLQRVVGPNGRVWCFEPGGEAAELLRRNLALNGVDLLARVVAGDAWPHLDDWCDSTELERIDAIRAHGPGAAAVLAETGLDTLARHLPLVLLTQEHRIPVEPAEASPLVAELAKLGYSFHSGADLPEAEAQDPDDPVVGSEAAASAACMLAMPPGKPAEGADG
jgi:hypothetical protein